MKKFQRLFAVLLALMLAVVFMGCGDPEEPTTDEFKESIIEFYDRDPGLFATLVDVFKDIYGIEVTGNDPNSWSDKEWKTVSAKEDDINATIDIVLEVIAATGADYESLKTVITESFNITLNNNDPTKWNKATWLSVINNYVGDTKIRDMWKNPYVILWGGYDSQNLVLENYTRSISFKADGILEGEIIIRKIYLNTNPVPGGPDIKTLANFTSSTPTYLTGATLDNNLQDCIDDGVLYLSVEANEGATTFGYISYGDFLYSNYIGLEVKNGTKLGDIWLELGNETSEYKKVFLSTFTRSALQ